MTDFDASKVLEGRDDFLFLKNDVSRVIDQIEGSYQLGDRFLLSVALAHAARRQFCAMVGAKYYHFIVPDRETVLSRYLPDTVVPERNGLRPILQYRRSGAELLHKFRYRPELLKDRGDETYFQKHDTHWTFEGAYRYSNYMLRTLGLDQDDADLEATKEHSYKHVGDLGSKIGREPKLMTTRFPTYPHHDDVYDNGLPNTGRIRLNANPTVDPSKRFIFLHDSFGHTPKWLLARYASAMISVHTPDFDPVLIKRFRPSHVIMLQIERFFIRCPVNDVDYNELSERYARNIPYDGSAREPVMQLPPEYFQD